MKHPISTDSAPTEIKSIDMKLIVSYMVFSALFLVAVYGLSDHPDIRSAYEAAVMACQC